MRWRRRLAGRVAAWQSLPMSAGSLALVVPCGLPLALGCRRLWRLGYRRGAWLAGIGLGVLTIAASVVAGLPGPVAIAVCAVVLGLPAWRAWWWLGRRGRCRTAAGRLRSKRDRRSAGGNGNDQQTGTHEFPA